MLHVKWKQAKVHKHDCITKYLLVMKHFKTFLAALSVLLCLEFVHAQAPSSYVTANFNTLTNEGCPPFVALLFDSSRSDNTITGRYWVITNAAGDTVYQDNSNKTTIGLSLEESGCYTVSLKVENRFSVSDYIRKQSFICVKPKPQINFTLSTMSGCPPLTVNYHCNSQAMCGSIDSVTIDFKNGLVESFPACADYTTSYLYSGDFYPTIYAKNSCGCYADTTFTAPIVVAQKPTASFTATDNTLSCTAPYTVNFSAHVQNSRTKYKWFVNNVELQNDTNTYFNHTFNGGNHDVMLVVQDSITGCTDTLKRVKYIIVGQPAIPNFTADEKAGCVPLKVKLTNTTNGTPTNLKWIITDAVGNIVLQRSGSPALFDSISYTFSSTGKYNVCLINTYYGGCMDTFCAPNYITVGNLPNSDFTVDKTQHCITPATSVASLIAPCANCTYDWSTTGLPNSNQALLSATYTTRGKKSISVTVTDENGCSSTTTKNDIINIADLKAKIFKTGKGGCAPYTVSFRDSTSSPDPIVNVVWSMPGADISTASGANPPAVTYSNVGVYEVTMQVRTASGCTSIAKDTIRVSNKPVGAFTVNPSTVCYEELPNLFKWNGSAADTIFWFFGDGGKKTTTIDSVKYTYQDLGDFTPCVIASNGGCRSDSICMNTITVNGPVANIKDSMDCSNRKEYFYLNKSKEATSFIWAFCDGTTSTQFDEHKLYSDCDTCSVKLTVYSSVTGCTHSKTVKTNVICAEPDFTISDTIGCANFRPTFTNISKSKSSTKWDFNIADTVSYTSGTASIIAPNKTYVAAGYYGVSMINTDANGCKDTITKPNLLKITNVTAKMGVSDTVLCIPQTANFSNSSTSELSSIIQNVWSFGDGSPVDSSLAPSHEYTTQGLYRAKLTVYNEYGCKDTASRNVLANDITAGLTFDDSTCVGMMNLFTNRSTGLNQVYQWHFPGGVPSYSIGRNVNVVYHNEGDYPVMLITHDNTGTCRDTIRDTIHVYNPVANYGLSGNYAQCSNPPFLVEFYDSSRNDISAWEWDFGDGTPISNLQNPSHYYSRAGTFPVRLTVRTNNGCSSTVVKDTIRVEGPYATMAFSPLPGICPCDSVEFTISTVSASEAILLDGQNSPFTFPPIVNPGTFDNPVVLKRKVQFCTSGTANAQVLVSDGAGCNVLLQPVPVLVDTPATHFSYVNNVCDSGSVCFTDDSKFYTPGTEYVSRIWDFGDGTTDTSATPCHVFKAAGDYTVTLTVFNNLGCSKSETQTVHIQASPQVLITASDTSACLPKTIKFNNYVLPNTNLNIASYDWGFGNGDTASSPSPAYTYNTAGTYNVTLTVIDSVGCHGSANLNVRVHGLPDVQAMGDTTICEGGVAQLSGMGGVRCTWSPSIGLNDPASCNPIASPVNDQKYMLFAIDSNGCSGKDSVTVKVAKINANFMADTVCHSETTHFIYTGNNTNSTFVSYYYFLGDGDSAVSANHNHKYDVAGNYFVRLIITDNHGCKGDTIQTVVVKEKPTAQAMADTTCFGLATTLTDVSSYGSTNVASRLWNLGVANQASSDSIVSFNYPNAGTYVATLKVTNDLGCSDSISLDVFVRTNPKADFIVTEACEGNENEFTSTSQRGTGAITSMLWDFNTANAGQDTSSKMNNVAFIYAGAGTYNASLNISDNFGCNSNTTKLVTVFSTPQALFSVKDNCTNSEVNFKSNSVAGSNPITSYNWNFGVGMPASSTLPNPSVQVGFAPGTYPVQLVVSDAKGCADTLNTTFQIVEGPQAAFFIYDTTVCMNSCVQLTSLSIPGGSNISSYSWDMESGSTALSGNKVQCYQYSSPGVKTIRLSVEDANGCKDELVRQIQVLELPKADFQWQAVCEGTPMALINQSKPGTGALASCLWLFHDGSFRNACNTNKVFYAGGEYPISLVSIDEHGCVDTTTQIVHVDAPTQLNLEGDTTVCKGEMVAYNAEGVFTEINWTPDTYLHSSSSANVIFRPSSSVKYIVEAKNGACKEVSDTVLVDVIQQVPISVSADPNKVLLGVNTNISAEVGGMIDSIIWSPRADLDCYNCLNPQATPQATTTYYATIYYSMNGVTCTQTDSVTISVFKSCDETPIFIPNTFTPNGDGLNDGFTIRGIGISKVKNFRIFDRWGKMVFATENAPTSSAAATWYGTDMSGKELNPGVFVYMYEIECQNNEVIIGQGNISLIK